MKKNVFLLVLVHLFVSCSTINKVAVKTTAGVIDGGSDEVLTEGNWHFFSSAAPANLKLIEGLWYSDQKNKTLLTLLIKGYAAYSFATLETRALSDLLKEKSNSFAIDQAIITYQKAIFYGFKYLELSGISEANFLGKNFSAKLKTVFSDAFDEDDYVAILYFAQAFGSSINIQRQDVSKMAHLSQVKEMLSWVCGKDPELERGNCSLFEAIIQASTPTLLGGSQQVAKKQFKKLIDEQPYNLLARLSYIQYHIVPMIEEEEFSVEMEKLNRDLNNWYNSIKGKKSVKSVLYLEHRDFNLFNSIAKEKYEVLRNMRNDFF